MARSIEFLIHYNCPHCGFTWSTGDRYPLKDWICQSCKRENLEHETETHLNLMTVPERKKFSTFLRIISDKIAEQEN